MPAPQVVSDSRDRVLIQCPNCGIYGTIDREQFRGEVSIDCPDCPYHETHDLRKRADSSDS